MALIICQLALLVVLVDWASRGVGHMALMICQLALLVVFIDQAGWEAGHRIDNWPVGSVYRLGHFGS